MKIIPQGRVSENLGYFFYAIFSLVFVKETILFHQWVANPQVFNAKNHPEIVGITRLEGIQNSYAEAIDY